MDDAIAPDDDFGHIVHRRPREVLFPRSTDDVVAAVRRANDLNLPLVARGRGHSAFGQAQTDGMLLETRELADVVVDGDTVIAGAGASWRQVLAATHRHGLTPPVLTDFLDLAVGGTLSVGGIGGTSYRYGLQADQVVELEVVTPDGTVRIGGPGDPALAGYGGAGVITRATVRLVPAPDRVRRRTRELPTITAVMAEQRALISEGTFDHVQGHIVPGEHGWRYVLEVASYTDRTLPDAEDLTYLDFADRLSPGETFLRETGEWFQPHPWWNGFLPDSQADDFAAALAAELTVDDLGATGLVLVYPIFTAPLTTPRFRVPDEPVVFLVAILRTVSRDAVETALRQNQNWYDRARAVGGTVYPISAIPHILE